MDLRRLDESLHCGRRPAHVQLLEKEGEHLFQAGPDRGPRFGRERPESLLERPDGFLPRLIDELGVGVLGFALVGGVYFQPFDHFPTQILGDRLVFHDDVLEGRG